MPDRSLLNQKITADFTQGETAEQIRDALNAKNIAVRVPIPTHHIKQYLILNDLWLAIQDSNAVSARVAVDALQNFDQFTVSNPIIDAKLSSILDALISAGLLQASDKTAIQSMGDATQSWADQNWDGDVTLRDVELEIN